MSHYTLGWEVLRLQSLEATEVCRAREKAGRLEGEEELHVAERVRTVSAVYILLRLTGSAAAPRQLAGSRIV